MKPDVTCDICWPANCHGECGARSCFDSKERDYEQYVINQACGGNWSEFDFMDEYEGVSGGACRD